MRRWAALLWLGLVLTAAGAVGWRLHRGVELRSDLVALLPGEEKGEAALRARLADALARRVVILVGAPGREAARQAAAALAARLSGEGLADLSSGGMDAAAMRAVGEVYAPHRRGLLSAADRGLLEAGRIDRLGERAAAKFFGLPGLVEGRQIAADPFLLLTDFFAALPMPASRLRPDQRMLSLVEGGTTWVMLSGKLRAEPYALATQRRLAAALEGVPSGVTVLRLGAAFFAGAGAERGLAESTTLGAISLAGTALLILAAFRSLRVLGVTLVSVGAGVVVAVAAVLALFAAPHVGVLVFGVGLIGAVMDYALQYAAEAFAGPAPPGVRLRRVLPGISIGAATTLIGYLTLWLAPFPGLRQLAVFAAVGLAGAWISVVLWLPGLERPSDGASAGWKAGNAPPRQQGKGCAERGGMGFAGCGSPEAKWTKLFCFFFLEKRSRLLAFVLLAVAALGWAWVRPADDIRAMQPPDGALMAEQARISALLGAPTPRFLAVSAGDDEAALRLEEALRGKVRGGTMPADFVPSAARQAENAHLAARLDGAALAAQAARLGIDPPAPAPEAPPLRLDEARRVLPFLDALVIAPGVHLVALAGDEDPAALRAAIAGVKGVRLVDPAADFSDVLARYRARAMALLALSAALMAPLLGWRYRRRAWRVLAAPLIAVAATPVLRAWAGAGFSFFDAMALVLVLAVGVDYAVFYAETTPARRPVTAAGVGLAAGAALLSFGVLAASSVPAVRGFGLTMALGIVLATLLAPMAGPSEERKSSFFEKKEAKKLPDFGSGVRQHRAPWMKSFLLLLPSGKRSASFPGSTLPHWAALRERGTGLGFWLTRMTYRLGGRGLCRGLLAVVATWFWLGDARRRGWTREYLRRVGARHPGRGSLGVFVRFAWRGLDNFIALADPARLPGVEVSGLERVDALLAAGRGGLMLVCHHGNVEICRPVLSRRLGRRLTVLMHTAQAARYNDLLRRFGREESAETLEVGDFGPAAAIALAERVEAGEWVAIAADRPPLSGERRALRVPFLGAPAAFAEGPFLMAALLGCPVVLLFCTSEGRGYRARLEVFADRLVLPRRGRAAALAEAIGRYAARLEGECRREPLQWYNFFDFWAEPMPPQSERE